ncbi:hypothetical protein [Nocardia brasiliensis]
MKKTFKTVANFSMIVAAVGGVALVGSGTANAAGMSYDQCMSEVAKRQAAWDADSDPNQTRASHVKFYCRDAGVNTDGNKAYEVSYYHQDI